MPRRFGDLKEYERAAATASTLLRSPYDAEEHTILDAMVELRDELAADATPAVDGHRVSVVLPVLDRADVVSRAILSVLTQTHRNLDLVVIDDGSTDTTAEVVGRFDDPRLTLVSMGTNQGHAAARNRGLQTATGEFVAYLDSDDWWDADLVRVLAGVLVREDAAFAYSAQRVLRPYKAGQPSREQLIRFSPYNRSLLENNNYISMISVMHRRDAAIEVGGFDESFRRYSDWNFFLRLSERFPPLAVPTVLSTYDQGTAGSVSGTEDRQRARTHLRDTLARRSLLEAGLELPAGLPSETAALLGTAFGPPDPPAAAPPLGEAGVRPATVVVVHDGDDDRLALCLAAVRQFTPQVRIEVVGPGDEPAGTEPPPTPHHTLGELLQEAHAGELPGDVALVHSDVLVTPGWLEAAMHVLERHPCAAVVAPRMVVFPHDPRAGTHVPGVNPEFECDITLSRSEGNILDPAFDPPFALYELSHASFACVLLRGASLADAPLDDLVISGPGDRAVCTGLRAHRWQVLYTPASKVYRLPHRGDR